MQTAFLYDYDKQQLVVTLKQGKPTETEVAAKDVTKDDLNKIIEEFVAVDGKVLLEDAKAGSTVSLAALGKELTLGNATSYVLASGRKITGVTITAEVTNRDDQTVLKTDEGSWELAKDVSAINSDEDNPDTLPQISVTASIAAAEEDGG